MRSFIHCIDNLMSNSRHILLLCTYVSACALASAFVAEYVFGLAPCNLCIIQRWPFVVVIALGLTGYAFGRFHTGLTLFTLASCSITLFANAAVAFYHSGVERKWWSSFLEGCAVPDLSAEGSVEALIAQIESSPIARCDEIPWADPILGLSMANYNVALCLGLATLSTVALWRLLKG